MPGAKNIGPNPRLPLDGSLFLPSLAAPLPRETRHVPHRSAAIFSPFRACPAFPRSHSYPPLPPRTQFTCNKVDRRVLSHNVSVNSERHDISNRHPIKRVEGHRLNFRNCPRRGRRQGPSGGTFGALPPLGGDGFARLMASHPKSEHTNPCSLR